MCQVWSLIYHISLSRVVKWPVKTYSNAGYCRLLRGLVQPASLPSASTFFDFFHRFRFFNMQSNWLDASFRIATPLALLLFIPRPWVFLLWCAPLKINGTMQRTWGMEVAEVALDILRCAGRVLPSVKKQKRHFALPNQLIRWEFTTASHCLKHCPLCCARQSFNGVLENYPSEQQRFRLVKVMALFGVKSSAEEFNLFKVCSNFSTVLTGSEQLQLYSYTAIQVLQMWDIYNIPNIWDIQIYPKYIGYPNIYYTVIFQTYWIFHDVPLGICGTSIGYPNWNIISQLE